jgi:hypothetical protein
MLGRIEDLAAEAQAGYLPPIEMMTPLEFELMLHWTAVVKSIEREQQRVLVETMQALFR